jgi:hypothetical protein
VQLSPSGAIGHCVLATLLTAEPILAVGAVEEFQIAVGLRGRELGAQLIDGGSSSIEDHAVLAQDRLEAIGGGLDRPGDFLDRRRLLLADRHQDLLSRASIAHPPGGGNRSRTREIAADADGAGAGDVDRHHAELSEIRALRAKVVQSSIVIQDGIEQPLAGDGVNETRREGGRAYGRLSVPAAAVAPGFPPPDAIGGSSPNRDEESLRISLDYKTQL